MAISHCVDAALDRAKESCGISREDAVSLMEEGPLPTLLETAAAVPDRFKGRPVSYSKEVFIPLTHLYRDYCGYCAFRNDPQTGVPAFMAPDGVLAVPSHIAPQAQCQPPRIWSSRKMIQ